MFRRAIGALSGAEADRDAAQLWYELGGLLDAAGDGLAARDAYRSAAACLGLVQPDVQLSRIDSDVVTQVDSGVLSRTDADIPR